MASKQLIFDLRDERAVDRGLDRIEALAADDDALLAFWHSGCRI